MPMFPPAGLTSTTGRDRKVSGHARVAARWSCSRLLDREAIAARTTGWPPRMLAQCAQDSRFPVPSDHAAHEYS